jgi:hypothetical protein
MLIALGAALTSYSEASKSAPPAPSTSLHSQ